MAAPFRPYPDPSELKPGWFNPIKFITGTIQHAPLHFAGVIPHVVIVIYGFYRLFASWGWIPREHYAVALGLIPLAQGAAAGALVGSALMRYNVVGRLLARKVEADSATASEQARYHRAEFGVAISLYVIVGT